MNSIINHTITVFVPAYNEERNLKSAMGNAIQAVKGKFLDYEILILNAYSSDKTGEIADALAATNKKVKVIHRKSRYGLGANYKKAVDSATMEYFIMFPGDNENSYASFSETLNKTGSSDIIIPYTVNKEVRTLHRRILSSSFVKLLSILFRLNLKYYNGNALYKTASLKDLSIHSQDFAYNAEILIKLIRSGCSYKEIGIHIKPTSKTAIFRLENILGVMKSVIFLFFDVNIIHRRKYMLKS